VPTQMPLRINPDFFAEMQDLACLATFALQPEDLAELVRCGLTSALKPEHDGAGENRDPNECRRNRVF
jgi:hypothetical protein